MSNQREGLTEWSDNVLVMRVGRAVRQAMMVAIGDDIDRGLAAIKYLNAAGFALRATPTEEQER